MNFNTSNLKKLHSFRKRKEIIIPTRCDYTSEYFGYFKIKYDLWSERNKFIVSPTIPICVGKH